MRRILSSSDPDVARIHTILARHVANAEVNDAELEPGNLAD
jgi:hypothetical protein